MFFSCPACLAGLKRICKAIAEARNDEERMKAFGPLQEIITFVQFANDECDYGMGYELGIDLFCYGSHVCNIFLNARIHKFKGLTTFHKCFLSNLCFEIWQRTFKI